MRGFSKGSLKNIGKLTGGDTKVETRELILRLGTTQTLPIGELRRVIHPSAAKVVMAKGTRMTPEHTACRLGTLVTWRPGIAG